VHGNAIEPETSLAEEKPLFGRTRTAKTWGPFFFEQLLAGCQQLLFAGAPSMGTTPPRLGH
jgi:hypothetical protein